MGGSTVRQLAQAGRYKYSVPWTSRSVYESGLAGMQESALVFSTSVNLLLASSLNFSGTSVCFGSFAKIARSTSLGFHNCCSGTSCKLVTGW